MGVIGILVVGALGVAFYFVVIAPPGSGDPSTAQSEKSGEHQPQRSKGKPETQSTAPRTSRNRKNSAGSQSSRAGELALEPIDAVGAMPSIKSLPAVLIAYTDKPVPAESKDDVASEPESSESAAAIWEKARDSVDAGELEVAIAAIQDYLSQGNADKHRDEAKQLLKEARIANSDEETIDAYLGQLNDENLATFIMGRAEIDPGFKFTDLVLNEIFQRALRQRAPAEKRRREKRAKNPAE